METLVVLLLVAFAAWVGWKLWKKPDLNNDGAFDSKDVVAAVKEVATEAKVEAVNVLDVNKWQLAGWKVIALGRNIQN